jgi:glycosyltransferase involved in cell wall biosynthesis
MEGVSIVICTQNRADLLINCLRSFFNQDYNRSNVEFVIVANACTDHTIKAIDKIKPKFSNLKLVNVSTPGLSVARNHGVKSSSYAWICFLDDDAMVFDSFIDRLFYNIVSSDCDAFGGVFYPWYQTKKPKWLSVNFGKMYMHRMDRGTIQGDRYLAGGICCIKKEWLIRVGGFPENIGMRGDTIGYGEENVVQDVMRKMGAKIFFDPEWQMNHLVANYKLHVNWHLKRSYAKGRDFALSNQLISFQTKCKWILKAFLYPVYIAFKNWPYLLIKRNYYFQNYFLDVFTFSFNVAGKIFSR